MMCLYLYEFTVCLSLCAYKYIYICILMCICIFFKSVKKWKDKNLGRIGEIMEMKRERKILALRKQSKN